MNKEEGQVGMWEAIMNAPSIEYNPKKFWEENTWESIFKDLLEMSERERRWKEETGWKPEYILTAAEAAESTYDHLDWLCKKYRVLCGIEAYEICQNKKPT